MSDLSGGKREGAGGFDTVGAGERGEWTGWRDERGGVI